LFEQWKGLSQLMRIIFSRELLLEKVEISIYLRFLSSKTRVLGLFSSFSPTWAYCLDRMIPMACKWYNVCAVSRNESVKVPLDLRGLIPGGLLPEVL
jgi:hypothetical protein